MNDEVMFVVRLHFHFPPKFWVKVVDSTQNIIKPTEIRFGYLAITNQQHYLLTYSMVQGPSWKANWFAASQEIPRTSRNPEVHYRTHKRPPPVSLLGQPNSAHIPSSHLLEVHPNIIHPSTPRSRWTALRIRNVSDKLCTETQTTHFMLTIFFLLKIVPFMR